MRLTLLALLAFFGWFTCPVAAADVLPLAKSPGGKQRNIVVILTDDHRYDAMGVAGHPFLETPHLDSLAKRGAYCKNAFVTTALCSPSRASLLTGLYAHHHGVVDNINPVSKDLVFFPQYLQQAGYQTAFIGKWHMGGDSDDPQRGFNHWVSFRGQGSYWDKAKRPNSGFNVDGKRVPQTGYMTDELTDYAVKWLNAQPADQPFLLYLSHKAVHSEFVPADRHKGRYQEKPFTPPVTQNETPENLALKPMWVRNQRNSFHGVEFPYHSKQDVANVYRRYCETLLAVDESVGKVLDVLKEKQLLESTLVLYVGDNGFMFGEQGLIDKRTAYEASMRVPMLVQCPELIPAGTVVNQVVANIDVAPTLLAAAGLTVPTGLDGRNFLPLLEGKQVPWRNGLLYEYYWERTFPQTPTVHCVRGERFKYMRYHGLWDVDELYDLQADPHERKNLIHDPAYRATVREMNEQLFAILKETSGLHIPLLPDRGGQANLRSSEASKPAEFPMDLIRTPAEK